MSHISTPTYTLDRAPRTGSILLRNRHTGQCALVQGLDVVELEAEIERCPIRYLDQALAQHEWRLR